MIVLGYVQHFEAGKLEKSGSERLYNTFGNMLFFSAFFQPAILTGTKWFMHELNVAMRSGRSILPVYIDGE